MARKPSASGSGSKFYSEKGFKPVSTHLPEGVCSTIESLYSGNGTISMERIARMLLLYAVKQKPSLDELFALVPPRKNP